MVQSKHQKPKQKKQPHIKKHGKQASDFELRAQLDALGLRIIQVIEDGNCFFRALADQLEGNEDLHKEKRIMVNNREMFEPFIEDEVPFDEYCRSMEKDATWAGNMELQAASLVTHSNICIHRNSSPRWYIRNFVSYGARMIHLSYHDGEHYNSVRLKGDLCDGPARPIIIKADADLSATSHQPKIAASRSKNGDYIDAGSVKLVMAGTACHSAEKAIKVLHDLEGDIDAAVEFLVAEQGIEECLVENHKVAQLETSYGRNENGNCEPHGEENKTDTDKEVVPSKNIKPTSIDARPQKDDKKVARNKVCPCGSRKKYKACCGSVAGTSSTMFAVNQIADSTKSQRGQKQGKKGRHAKASPACTYSNNGPTYDMESTSSIPKEKKHIYSDGTEKPDGPSDPEVCEFDQ